jgi:hypothetical protein
LKKLNLKKLAAASALGLFALIGTSSVANAQNRTTKEDQKMARKQAKLDQERARLQQQREADWARRNGQMVVRRNNGTGYYTLQTNANIAPPGRYRVNRGGRWYTTDERGADMLRQAINEGYRQGFNAGRSDYGSNAGRAGPTRTSIARERTATRMASTAASISIISDRDSSVATRTARTASTKTATQATTSTEHMTTELRIF